MDNSQLDISVSDYLDTITENRKLKSVLNYLFLTYGTQPRDAPLWMNSALFRHYMDGGFYPTGGSYAMTKALAEPIWARGGKILIRSHVKEILVQNGKAVGVRVLPCFVGDHNKGVESNVYGTHIISTCSIWHTNTLIKGEWQINVQ